MSGSGSKTCSLCCREASAWAVSVCDHPSCLTCCARLRVLCGQKECPVCREQLELIKVSEKPKPFTTIHVSGQHSDPKHGFQFTSRKLFDLYKSLNHNKCMLCPERPSFRTFNNLREHIRKSHSRQYCEICTENLKLFPSEFKTYTRQELVRHRKEGDPDDTSYKGHPLCQFCDDRYLDNDALHKHLTHNHFWCHFCESNGKQEYYCDYPLLRMHFKRDHYLCEEGQCKDEKFTSVFWSKIDLQAHKAAAHSKGMSKSEVKQLRNVEVGFTYSKAPERDGMPPPQMRHGGNSARGQWQSQQTMSRAQMKEREDLEVATAVSLSLQQPNKRKSNKENERIRNKSPPVAAGKSTTQNQPKPRSQERQEGVLAEFKQDQGLKKPPGFETLPHGSGRMDEWPDPTEWPDIMSNPQSQPTALPTGHPSQFTMGYPKPVVSSQPTLPPPGLMLSSDRGAFGPPPGFAMGPSLEECLRPFSNQYRHHQHQDSRNGHKLLEAEVIAKVRRMLEYDNVKFSEFKTLSGWYKNNEISVQEYAAQCYALFGEAWQEIGPQLARVLPVQSKQRELLALFRATRASDNIPMGRRIKSKKSKARMAQPPGLEKPWVSGRPSSKVGLHPLMLSEDEYPTLSVAAKQPDPPKVLHEQWNMKASA